MKKIKGKLIIAVITLIVAFLTYYLTLPALNIHSADFWWFILFVLLIINLFILYKRIKKQTNGKGKTLQSITFKDFGVAKYGFYLIGCLVIIFIIGSILSSPIVNASKYQKLLTVTERDFTTDIKPVNYSTIPTLDKDSATILGNRKMGGMVDMVSQFEVSDDYTQINYQGTPVRVSPLEYASFVKWITNQNKGIPAFMKIDMTNQNTECVQLKDAIKYSKSEYFNRNIYRHLRFQYPTYIFSDQIFFEIDDEGVPYWICPVKQFEIGLFGGQTIGRTVICNASTGECVDYAIKDVPQWVDKVYQAELLMQLYDYSGTLKHGYFNSVLGQKDSLETTNGYNYIALEDDVWVYSGVTSVSGDQSNVGFVLMNQRTMETRFYKVEGAIEDSAMSSAEGQVQNLQYQATFPLLLNIANEPTYFIALKDGAGLVKMYAMVNIQKYQWVAIGDTVKECEKAYKELLTTNGIVSKEERAAKKISATIQGIQTVVLEGNTHIYFSLTGSDLIFGVDMTNSDLVSIVKYNVGDKITVSYLDDVSLVKVIELK